MPIKVRHNSEYNRIQYYSILHHYMSLVWEQSVAIRSHKGLEPLADFLSDVSLHYYECLLMIYLLVMKR